VDHRRWSQAHERRIDSTAFPKTMPTLVFSGYADQVANLYNGMDLKKYYRPSERGVRRLCWAAHGGTRTCH
jgi:hypothetical protein